MTRLADSAQWLAGEFSATRDEFRRANHPAGEMLLMGLLSNGYARRKGDDLAMTDAGLRYVAAHHPVDDPQVDE